MTVWICLVFLALSVYLYCLLGGADFGAGIHELFVRGPRRRQHEEIVKHAMGPVWEANHMWLIIAIVILFVGFPKIYTEVSIYLHIPITLMLIGIILRGCAFTFRHYDAVEDSSRRYYSAVFSAASVLTPVMLGIIIGALTLGRIDPQAGDYLAAYVRPWLNPFAVTTGLFVLSIFTFIAGVFMIGEETIGDFKALYIRRVRISHLCMVLTGGVVFVTAEWSGLPLVRAFIAHPVALTAVCLATLSHAALWVWLDRARVWPLRLTAGFQLLMVVAAWMGVLFPNALTYADGTGLSFFDAAAPAPTLLMLSLALIIGAVIFLPLLFYLIFVFKKTLR